MAVSSDRELRSHVRKVLGLTDSSRVPDSGIDTEIDNAKTEISARIAEKVENGADLDLYGEDAAETLANYVKIRMGPLAGKGRSGNGSGPPPDEIPTDHPSSLAHMRRYDFEDPELAFWRDRMVTAFNNI